MVEDISAAELHERLQQGNDVEVVDIRSEPAFRRGHIPGALNLPIHRFTSAIEDHDWGEEIVVACPHGESSLQAARLLEAYEGVGADATVSNLAEGYEGWPFDLEREETGTESPF